MLAEAPACGPDYDHPVHSIADGVDIRPLAAGDAIALTEAHQRNREHLAPWSPRREDRYFTLEGQQTELSQHLARIESGDLAAYLVVREDRILGRVNLASIIRGAFQSASIGYWVDRDEQNNGLATESVQFACASAQELGLHRVEAGTLVHNEASQRVLRKCGFTQFGTAADYLFINGRWQDHALYQRILNNDPVSLR